MSHHRRRVCLVTGELYPFTGGGIGRLIHNLLRRSAERSAPIEFHLLVPYEFQAQPEAIAAVYDRKVTLHRARSLDRPHADVGFDGTYPPPWALSSTPWHSQSMEFMLRLKDLAVRGTRFDVIEFPDYQGWAFCTLQEKLLGRAFADTEIAVRIHSTAGIIENFERRHLSVKQLGGFELERKALLDADRIVAHLPPIAEFNRRFYGFPPTWLDKVSIEFPPVVERGDRHTPRKVPRQVVFGGKIQPIKRPDLFVRGAALFMKHCPDFTGPAIFATEAAESVYLRETLALIPRDLAGRFVFLEDSPGERERLLGESLVVVPSDHESLNLMIYEAHEAGGIPIVNGTCPAFGPDTPFVDGMNCHKFDGSCEGLAAALEQAWRRPATGPIAWEAHDPYWENESVHPVAPAQKKVDPLVSVIITNYNLGLHLPEALASIAASSYPNVETIVVDDASTEPLDRLLFDEIARDQARHPTDLRIIRNEVNLGLTASRNLAIRRAKGLYVLPLDADDCINPGFIELAVRALESHSEFDVVVPTAAYFLSDEDIPELRFCDYATFLGDVPSLGLLANRFSCATSMMRRSLFERFSYNQTLSSYEDWDLYLRLALDGRRFLVTNDLHFYYRLRKNSMVRSMPPQRHAELLARIYEALPRPLPHSVHLFGLATAIGAPAHLAAASNVEIEPRPLRHEVVDSANALLKLMPGMHHMLRQTIALTRRLRTSSRAGQEVRPLRHELADSLNAALTPVAPLKRALKRVLSQSRR